jgi:signal transduction histidine kinase
MSVELPLETDEWRELVRQARQMQTAYSIIQSIHGQLSLNAIAEGIVRSLVEIGGLTRAEISIDATFDDLHVASSSRSGMLESSTSRRQQFDVFARGVEVGTLTVHYEADENEAELIDLLDYVLPTIYMSVDNAISFAEVEDYRRTLEEKVVERTAQLAEANQELERTFVALGEAKSARDRFFANINHEIRTPLTLIQLATDGIMRSGEAVSDGALQKLDEINSSTRRLLHLVNSLLLLAAGDEGKLRVRPGPCDVAACIKRLTRNWVTAAQKGEIELVYVGPPQCAATMDEAALETIIGNFVSNAIKFTPPKGRITVTLLATDDDVTIEVRDTGPGIDPEFIPQLFGRFERAASAVAQGVRGTGIGLSLSKELVDLQGGTVNVQRREDPRGTSFEVTLPRHQAVAGILPTEQQPPEVAPVNSVARVGITSGTRFDPPGLSAGTIVIAEDDVGLAEATARVLSNKYTVIVGLDGALALELVKKYQPQLLITDVEMPNMNGLELAKRFRELTGDRLSPIIILSAAVDLGTRVAGLEAGAVDYVTKPFDSRELSARVDAQFRMRELAVRLHQAEQLSTLGILTSGLAHELRNPANGIVNAIGPLTDLLPPELCTPETGVGQLLSVMSECADQIAFLSRQLLGFRRGLELDVAPANLSKLIKRSINLASQALVGVEVRTKLGVEQPLLCSGPLLIQALTNLVENAGHAVDKNGGWVEISTRIDADHVLIELTDSGPGVPVALRERIFEPFYTTKPADVGTGLGLSVSKAIVQRHGGVLEIRERGGRPAFVIELPADSGQPGRRARSDKRARP